MNQGKHRIEARNIHNVRFAEGARLDDFLEVKMKLFFGKGGYLRNKKIATEKVDHYMIHFVRLLQLLKEGDCYISTPL